MLGQSVVRSARIFFGVLIAYIGAARLGWHISATEEVVASSLWPASGVALAALVLWGPRFWPAILLGDFLVERYLGVSTEVALAFSASAAAGAYAAAELLRRANWFHPHLNKLRSTIFYAFGGATLHATVSSGIKLLAIAGGAGVAHMPLLDAWVTWAMGDLISDLVFGAVVLAWFAGARPKITWRTLEYALFLALLLGVIFYIFGRQPSNYNYPMSYVTMPFVIWAALRFGTRGTTFATATLSVVTIWKTIHGDGPFAVYGSAENLFVLQCFEGLFALTGLVLTSAVAEARTLTARLRAARDELDNRVQKRTEELQSAEDRFRFMIENLPDYAIYMLDSQGHIMSWNEGARRIEGFGSHEVLGSHFSRFYLPEDIASGKPDRALIEAIENGRFSEEALLLRKDGSTFWAAIALTAIRNTKGDLVGISKITRDLTEQKEAKDRLSRAYDDLELKVRERTKELARSRDQLDVILSGISDAIAVIDDTFKFVYINEACANLLAVPSVESLVGVWAEDGFDRFQFRDEQGRLLPFVKSPAGRAIFGFTTAEVIVRYRRFDTDEERWGLMTSSPVFDESRRVSLSVTILKDFTERKRLQDTLTYLDKVQRILASSMNLEQTMPQIASLSCPALADLCVIELHHESEKAPVIVTAHHDPNLKERFQRTCESLLRQQILFDAEKVFATGESSLFSGLSEAELRSCHLPESQVRALTCLQVCSGMTVPIEARGKVLGTMSLLMTTSLRRFHREDVKLAEELGRRVGMAIDNAILFQQAQTAVRVRDEFLSIASHELKTPMTSMKLQLALRKRRLSNHTFQPDALEQMMAQDEKQIDRINRLVDEMLDISRIRAGRLQLNREWIDIRSLVDDVVERFRPQLDGAGCAITVEGSLNMLGSWDRGRTEQLFTNLLSNAMKYGAKRPIRVQISQVPNRVILTVTDHGIGIAEQDRERIFDRFERTSNVEKISGLGLGLYIVKQIVDAHGGRVRVESVLNEGSTFIVELPIEPVSESGVRP